MPPTPAVEICSLLRHGTITEVFWPEGTSTLNLWVADGPDGTGTVRLIQIMTLGEPLIAAVSIVKEPTT